MPHIEVKVNDMKLLMSKLLMTKFMKSTLLASLLLVSRYSLRFFHVQLTPMSKLMVETKSKTSQLTEKKIIEQYEIPIRTIAISTQLLLNKSKLNIPEQLYQISKVIVTQKLVTDYNHIGASFKLVFKCLKGHENS